MDFNVLTEKIARHYRKNLPFAIYSFPETDLLHSIFQNDDSLHVATALNKPGFVLAPFDYKGVSLFIPANESGVFQTEFVKDVFNVVPVPTSSGKNEENRYCKLLSNTIETIKQGEASKIVISRPKDFQLHNFSVILLLKRLFSAYPTAFRYIWFHPKTGIWCGATPETLVQVKNDAFKTMALAGTQAYTGSETVSWRPKEKDEQQQVTDMILEKLKMAATALQVSDTYTYRAGSLLHLRTDITGKLNQETTLAAVANALHPTPAVGGNPKIASQEYIIKNEGYPRAYYTGFVGPILENGTSASLMVNLRCMKIQENIARIFVGGGITRNSDPKEEWEETQNKMQTMLHVLKPMLS
ncbi:isochorismate synthase [Aequorivita marina]|uniref:isochorismate synthase n=1 Tax=Aequorivita marina TaxID=3073654 RepID=UPI00287701B1|nr:isochorismate synthase [Aequorivita sp. S2608]MDS1297573.1 isochorismate synthase [Aequorivita sp. S2608]